MKDLHIDWQEYYRLVERLIVKLHETKWRFNQIVCLARGGLRVGDVLSRVFDIPLAILATHSYKEEGLVRGSLRIAEQMTMTSSSLGDKILLVDDMVDSGETLQAVFRVLPERYPEVREWHTAVLWYKAHSIFKPDYYVDYLPDSPWIHQPFERYDHLRPEHLVAEINTPTP